MSCMCVGKKKRAVTVVLLGVDNAGKSTLLYSLRKDFRQYITPTVGFSTESVLEGRYNVTVFDLGGCANFRGIWGRYYAEVHGAILVVDGADQERLASQARPALQEAIHDPRLEGKPVVLFVNKQDAPGCLPPADAARALGMPTSIPIYGCTARSKDPETVDPRLRQGLQSLIEQIDDQWERLSARVAVLKAEQKKRDDEERAERARFLQELRAQREAEEAKKHARVELSQTTGTSPDAEKQSEGASSVQRASTGVGEWAHLPSPLPSGSLSAMSSPTSSLGKTTPGSPTAPSTTLQSPETSVPTLLADAGQQAKDASKLGAPESPRFVRAPTPERWKPLPSGLEDGDDDDSCSDGGSEQNTDILDAPRPRSKRSCRDVQVPPVDDSPVPRTTSLPGMIEDRPMRATTPPRRLAPLSRRSTPPIPESVPV